MKATLLNWNTTVEPNEMGATSALLYFYQIVKWEPKENLSFLKSNNWLLLPSYFMLPLCLVPPAVWEILDPPLPVIKSSCTCLYFQWDLVCDKSYLIETTNFLGILGGMTIGGALSILADHYGRKWIFLVCLIGAIAAGVFNGLCRTLLAYIITRVVLTTFQTVTVLFGGFFAF